MPPLPKKFDLYGGKWALTRGNPEESTAWTAFSQGQTPSTGLLRQFHEGRYTQAQPAGVRPAEEFNPMTAAGRELEGLMLERYRSQNLLRQQYTPQWQQQYTDPDTSGYRQALDKEYGIFQERLGKTFDIQSKSLEEYMDRRGIFYSGAHDRERRKLSEFRTQELNVAASQIAMKNYQEKQRKQMEAYGMLFPEDTAQSAMTMAGMGMQGAQYGIGTEFGYAGLQQDWQTSLLAARTSTDIARANRQAAGWGGLWQGIGTAAGAALISDRRLKKNISQISSLPDGLPVYSFNYIWDDIPQIGCMADEVKQIYPEAVIEIGGYDHVDYGRIGSLNIM